MDVQPIDQGAVLRSGQASVPNYAEQAIQRAMLGIRQQEAQTQAMGQQRLQQQFQRETARQDAFSQAIEALGPNPDARALAGLAIQFPEFSEAVKRGFDAMDTTTRRREFGAMAEITAAARAGRFDLAAQLMRARVQADQQAGGEPDPMDAAILTALESGEEGQQRDAVDFLERSTAAADPERYAQTYGTFQRRTQEVDGIIYDVDTGEAIVQSPFERVIPGPNGSFFTQPRNPSIPVLGGGGSAPAAPQAPAAAGRQDGGAFDFSQRPATPAAPARPARGAFDRQGAVELAGRYGQVTSTERSPRHNRAVGGAENSNHLARNGARAIDVARRRGVSHAQIVSAYRNAGYTIDPDTRDEGDHSHIVIASGPAGGGGAVRIRSRQEYERLPSGAQYIDPQGNPRVKR